jgi:SOS response regulatory protein OraA/RecX
VEDGGSLQKAKSYVMWLLARRDYPRRQLEEKLRKRELSPQKIKALLDSLVEEGWYKEDAFKKLRTQQLLKRGFGPSMVKAKMSRDRIVPSKEELDQAYSELDLSPEQQIRELLEKFNRRYAPQGLEPQKLRHKLFQALQRKGFNSSDILKALNSPHFGTSPK